MSRHKVILGGVALVVLTALVVRIWWHWPKELSGGPHVEKIEKRGKDYSVYLKTGSSISDVVAIRVFDGYSPQKHHEHEQRLENKPSRYVKVDDRHHYVEYVGKYGRMQFHSAINDDGPSQWLELIPTDLSVDSFFTDHVAVAMDLNVPEFKVYIPAKSLHFYMTINVKDRKVERIAWMEF